MTKTYRIGFWMLWSFHILLNITPLAVYTIMALVQGQLIYEKVALTMTVFIVLILSIISFVNKIALRSRLWIILIGVYVCLGEILAPLVIIASCQIIDELVVCPLKNFYKSRLTINKEIDKRI